MNIQITNPETEALIRRALQSGSYSNAEDLIAHALRATQSQNPTGADLVAAMQASPFKDEVIEPVRTPLPVRDVPV